MFVNLVQGDPNPGPDLLTGVFLPGRTLATRGRRSSTSAHGWLGPCPKPGWGSKGPADREGFPRLSAWLAGERATEAGRCDPSGRGDGRVKLE